MYFLWSAHHDGQFATTHTLLSLSSKKSIFSRFLAFPTLTADISKFSKQKFLTIMIFVIYGKKRIDWSQKKFLVTDVMFEMLESLAKSLLTTVAWSREALDTENS